MKTIVVDLDGTLCDSAHRDHHARNRDWEAFHSACSEDPPHGDVLWMLRALSGLTAEEEVELVGCTGRNEAWRGATEKWLMKHGVPLDDLIMRPDHDFRSDHELKAAMLQEWHLSTEPEQERTIHERVAFVLDDRDKVVEAWRDAGFNCWQVRPGNF